MPTTQDDIRGWLERGKAEGATHVVVMCDDFDHDCYPILVKPGQDPKEVVKAHSGNMQRMMEVYALHLDWDQQLHTRLSVRYDAPTAAASSPEDQELRDFAKKIERFIYDNAAIFGFPRGIKAGELKCAYGAYSMLLFSHGDRVIAAMPVQAWEQFRIGLPFAKVAAGAAADPIDRQKAMNRFKMMTDPTTNREILDLAAKASEVILFHAQAFGFRDVGPLRPDYDGERLALVSRHGVVIVSMTPDAWRAFLKEAEGNNRDFRQAQEEHLYRARTSVQLRDAGAESTEPIETWPAFEALLGSLLKKFRETRAELVEARDRL